MAENYFSRLVATTPSRVWINNPTPEEVDLALAQGAVGCTTNPAYGGSLLKRAQDQVQAVITAVVSSEHDDDEAAEVVQRRLVGQILPRFLPHHESSGGQSGFVSIQGAPEQDTEASVIAAKARIARSLGPNCIPKIPATMPGLEAFETLVAEGHPTLVTEVFSLAQVIEACERYGRVTAATGVRPRFIMAPITGIFGDHLRAVAAHDGIRADQSAIEWAGVVFARAAARLVAERKYPVTLLFGGARTMVDLTGLMGAEHQATVNWSTFAEVLNANPECRATIWDDSPTAITTHLVETFDDFRRALAVDGLRIEEFEGFGPVQHFRNNFVAGWQGLRGAIMAEREARLVGTS